MLQLYRFLSRLLLALLLTAITINATAKDREKFWNGKRAAVVLTYDDALNIHLDAVIPALNRRQLIGTFYLNLSSPAFSERMLEWRSAAQQGHELGNHTLFHPCAGDLPGREWVRPEYDLNHYSVERFLDEINLTNKILNFVDGLQERTFAYTCGDTEAGGESFVEAIKPHFIAARGVADSFTQPGQINYYNINAYVVHQQSGKELIAQARRAIKSGTMLVYLFHGVGGEHEINVSTKAHTQLLDFLTAQEDQVWVTSLRQASKYLKQH